MIKEAYNWQQRLIYLSQYGGGGGPEDQSKSPSDFRPLAVTERASAALKDILDNMQHESDQALRLILDTGGNLTLNLDMARQDDGVVTHQGAAVLFVEAPLPEGLEGATLDVSETPQGPSLVLSR